MTTTIGELKETTVHWNAFERYGLAVFLYKVLKPRITDDKAAVTFHAKDIEEHIASCLSKFRYRVSHQTYKGVKYGYIGLDELKVNTELVQSGGLSKKNVFLAPHVVTGERFVRKLFDYALNYRFTDKVTKPDNPNVPKIVSQFKTASYNDFQPEPRPDKLRRACSVIASLTDIKMCNRISDGTSYLSSIYIPNLQLEDLFYYVGVLNGHLRTKSASLMEAGFEPPKIGKDGKPVTGPLTPRKPDAYHSNIKSYVRREYHDLQHLNIVIEFYRDIKNVEVDNIPASFYENIGRCQFYRISDAGIGYVGMNHHIVDIIRHYRDFEEMVNGIINTGAVNEKTMHKNRVEEYYAAVTNFINLFNLSSYEQLMKLHMDYTYKHISKYIFSHFFKTVMNVKSEVQEDIEGVGEYLHEKAFWISTKRVGSTPTERQANKVKIIQRLVRDINASRDVVGMVSTLSDYMLVHGYTFQKNNLIRSVNSGEIDFKTMKMMLACYVKTDTERKEKEDKGTDVQTQGADGQVQKATGEDTSVLDSKLEEQKNAALLAMQQQEEEKMEV